jgi:cyclopropane-fatty-acyl-phospholipid synthase
MDRLLQFLLKTFIRRGTFRVTTSRGTVFTFGDGTGRPVSVRFASRAAEWGILLDPELKFGESYMNGSFVVEQGSIADVLAICLGQNSDVPHWALPQGLLRYLRRRLSQFNPRPRARRNVAHHYDLDGRLYSLFLDADRQYSCAYFEKPGQSLDDAQLAKKRHLAAKLRLTQDKLDQDKPVQDLRVLDIGCGWGGLGLYLAEFGGTDVTGVTLSQEQHAIANERAAEKGLSERARFNLQDYRDVGGPFDRIVSVGMFEHVGVDHYGTFFRKSAQLLNPDGVMLLHSIGRSDGPSVTSPWIAKYIFPGGYIPSLSEVLPWIEKAGLLVTDIEILRLHYAETLKAWRERFLAHRDEVERIYDQRFERMWEFYLAASEMYFREQNMMVFQIQLTKRQNVVPMTRDYIMREEQRLLAAEAKRWPPMRLAGE